MGGKWERQLTCSMCTWAVQHCAARVCSAARTAPARQSGPCNNLTLCHILPPPLLLPGRWFFTCIDGECGYWKWADKLPGFPNLTLREEKMRAPKCLTQVVDVKLDADGRLALHFRYNLRFTQIVRSHRARCALAAAAAWVRRGHDRPLRRCCCCMLVWARQAAHSSRRHPPLTGTIQQTTAAASAPPSTPR